MTLEERASFLSELEHLFSTYGVVVTACGCCKSPFTVTKEEWESWTSGHKEPTYGAYVKNRVAEISW